MALKLTSIAAGLALALAAGPVAAETAHWRLTSAWAETSNQYKIFMPSFAERVKQLTDGEVVIETFPAGVIAPSGEAYDAVIDGTADALHSSAVYIVNRDPANALLNVIPGGMGPEALMQWMYVGGGKELLAQHRRETMGLHAIPVGLGPTELFAHARKPIKTLADLQGVKFRTAGAFADILTELGAAPTVVPGTEVYTMLERGAIDAAEWSGPAEDLNAGLDDAAKYIIYPGLHTNAYFQEFAVRAEDWDALPKDLQEKIEMAAMINCLNGLMAFDKMDREAWAKIQAGNNEIVKLDDEVIKAIEDGGRKWVMDRVAEQDAKGDPWMHRIADSYFAFQDSWRNAVYRAAD